MSQAESNDDNAIELRGIPIPSLAYQPQLRAGRWLQPDDTYALVLNQVLAAEMAVEVGAWLTIDIPTRREANWQIVGLMMDPTDQEAAIVPRKTLLKEVGQVDQGKSLRIQTIQTDPASEIDIAEELRLLYQMNGYEPLASNEDTSRRLADKFVAPTGVLMALLSMLAGMMTLVGAIALSGTLSINVMERTREIGVMRAVGASTAAITGQFVGEGLLLGWLSWLIALPLSLPAGLAIVSVFSFVFNTEMVYRFAGISVLYWFGVVTIVAAMASWFPAWKASQTSVRESLVYA